MRGIDDCDIKFLKGIGPQRAELLAKELDVRTFGDLLRHFPTHYIDRSRFYAISNFAGADMPMVQVKGRFLTFVVQGAGRKRRLVGLFSDGTATMEVVWFNQISRLQEAYKTNTEYVLFGKPALYNGRWSMTHPEVDLPAKVEQKGGFRGVYPLTMKLRQKGIGSRQIQGWVQLILQQYPSIAETLPQAVIEQYRLPGLRESLVAIHTPQSAAELDRARGRLKFEELFYLQLNIRRFARHRSENTPGLMFTRVGRLFNRFYDEQLPFPLTEAQKRVMREIHADMRSGRQMNRLLQGDVGSGKTLVAVMTMLIALGNGYQATLMAPTEILATQHLESIAPMLAPLGINVKLLTGSTPKKERDIIHEQLESGALHILIGTHALIEDNVRFHNLGVAVIDEQHRFGVAQRARLWSKANGAPPHVLVMTATPIPRTLAMTVYGDLEVSVIDELPPGRKPVVTNLYYDNKREEVYRGVGRQLALGRQVYIVYPLINENETLDLRSLEEGYEIIRERFPSYKVAFVHGRMKPAEKDYQMGQFVSGQAHILVATTVIEVGVNVPNASVMVIENAERFGLSQLHQLRGRVGRGADQSFCILMSKLKIAKTTRQRLELMTSTSDGFVIAEADMKMRGPGDIEGTMQSGIPFTLRIANLSTDSQLVQLTRTAVDDILEATANLGDGSPQSMLMLERLTHLKTSDPLDWSKIS